MKRREFMKAAGEVAVAAEGLPVEISLSAGAYLCNAAFYLARHALEERGTPCGFLHLPPIYANNNVTGY